MGQVQIEVIKHLIEERTGINVSFGTGKILYKETICNSVEGVGHFEPLRHYAEVHLLLEPLEEEWDLYLRPTAAKRYLQRTGRGSCLPILKRRFIVVFLPVHLLQI